MPDQPNRTPLEVPANASQRRSNNTALIVISVLVAAALCVIVLCGGLALAGGALFLVRSQHSVVPAPTELAEQLPPELPAMTPLPVQDTPAATAVLATALPTIVTPEVALTPTPAISVESPAGDISTTTPLTYTAEDTARQLRIFDELWSTVNDSYVYTDFNGLDWAAVKITAETQISAGLANEQFYDLMRDAVFALGDNHSYFLSPEEAIQEEDDYQGNGEYVGIGILSDQNLEKHYAYVLQVLPDSPAMQAGIHPHDHLLAINGQPIVDEHGDLYLSLLRGPVGSVVTVTVQTPGDAAPRNLSMTRTNLSTSFPVESRILPGEKRIGYILIPTFFEEDMDSRVRTALRQLMKGGKLDGLVIDMRINNGGSYPVLMANLGFVTTGRVGALVDRAGTRQALSVRAERISNSQTVPLMVLIGPATESYAEVYAGALQAKGRAKLVGQRSAGNIETLHGHDFEDGSEAWLAEETFRLPDGTNWEGEGLQPDIVVDKNWDEYTTADDPILSAAVTALTEGQ
jgi:C-terminal peptidase prc